MTNNHTAPPPSPEPRSVGDHLRQLRVAQGQTIEDVAEATRISRSNLQALESMAHDRLPADTFIKGIIVLYATHLGIDGQQMAEQFFLERHDGKTLRRTARHHINDYTLTPKKLAEPAHVSSATIALLLFVLIVLSFSGFCLYTSWNPFSFLTGATDKLSSQVLASFHPADPATSSEAHKKLFNLELLFLKDAEVEIALDGGQARQQIFAKETAVRLEANEEIRVQFMEPNSATLHLNGTALPFPENVNGRFLLHIPATPPAQ